MGIAPTTTYSLPSGPSRSDVMTISRCELNVFDKQMPEPNQSGMQWPDVSVPAKKAGARARTREAASRSTK
jgi:hypothetical protein